MPYQVRVGLLVTVALVLAACSGPAGASTTTRSASTASTGATSDTAAFAETRPADPTATASPTPTIPATATSTSTPTEEPTATEPEPTETPTEEATPAEESNPTGTEETFEEAADTGLTTDFAGQVEALLADREGFYAVVAIGPGGAPEYRLNDATQVQAASLYKLLIMVEVYQQAAEGRITLDDAVVLHPGFFSEAGYDDPISTDYIGDSLPVDWLLRSMLMYSSNVAAYALLDLVGNDNVNATAAGLGMTASEIRWMPRRVAGAEGESRDLAALAQQETPSPTADEAFNVTSAADMALLFDLLLRGEVVSPEASAEMLEILSGQVINDRLPALLPADTTVAHKTGNIDNVIHDAGVIYTPVGPAIVVVLTADALEWQAVEFMRELALLVYQTASG